MKINKVHCLFEQSGTFKNEFKKIGIEALDIAIKALEEYQEWISVKYHNITDEEREKEDYPDEWKYYLDSPMPDDREEILITTNTGNVEEDINYIEDGYYLDSAYDWLIDVAAWKPLPKPYDQKNNK